MPELPEVETIARSLRLGQGDTPGIIGKTITGVDVYWDKIIEIPSVSEFKRRIVGQQIVDIRRRAKYFVFQLSHDTLLIHLRMSGDLLVGPFGEDLADHVRLSLTLDDRWQLAFDNTRKFGRAWLLSDPTEIFTNLGPEPFDPELTGEIFWQKLQQRTRQIKPLLLDQGFIAGLGNIYTDEALHLSKTHPKTRANRLTLTQAEILLSNIRFVLEKGIQTNGASIDWVYRRGDFQHHFRVYDREEKPCPVCGKPIEKIVVGQRGTHFCPTCQPTPKEEE
jgi:formamidopyrimidine-DNA glycosylase